MGEFGDSVKKSGENLQAQAGQQFEKGKERIKEGASNLAEMTKPGQEFGKYKLKDETRFKAGEILGKDKGIQKGSSVGAAVREAQSVSISSIGDDIRKAAMMASMGGGKTQEELLGNIEKNLDKENLKNAVAAGVGEALRNQPKPMGNVQMANNGQQPNLVPA
jgi:hypothetical protein